MKLLGNLPYFNGGHWPARRLKKRSLFKIYEIRVMLNLNYLQDNEMFYELREYRATDYAGLYSKVLEHKKIADYSTEQVRDEQLLSRDLESLIRIWNSPDE